MQSISLGEALFTKTQQKVLGLLYGRPKVTFYLNEIVRLSSMGKGTIKRELERMLSSGLVIVKPIGNQRHYQANQACPIYEELLVIVRKTFGLADEIRTALLPLKDKIDLAFIYGSMAKGGETSDSDIDLLVVTDSLAYADLVEALAETESSLGRTINPTIYTMKQIKVKLRNKNSFLTRVMEQPKLWSHGGEDDIRELKKLSKQKSSKGRTT